MTPASGPKTDHGSGSGSVPDKGVLRRGRLRPPTPPDRGRPRALHFDGWLLATAVVAASALLFKLWIALRTIGTNDVLLWEHFLAHLKTYGALSLYGHVYFFNHPLMFFNHPPFMVHVLTVLDSLTSLTGLPFAFWLRLPGIVADLASLVLLWRILEAGTATMSRRTALILFAGASTSIMVSGFHGNTDPIMVAFLLLSIMLLGRGHATWLAGAAFGMSMNVKAWPVVFVPAIYAYLPDRRRRLAYFAAAGAVFLVAGMPYVLQEPRLILEKVFNYPSLYGHWGLSRLTTWLASTVDALAPLDMAYARLGRMLLLLVIVVISFRMDRAREKPPLYLQCGVIAFTFVAFAPGFGVQYLAWLVPWVVGLGVWPTLTFYATSGVFLFLVYNFWAQEFPWNLADSIRVGEWHGFLIFFEVLCWVSVLVILVLLLRSAGVFSHRGLDRGPAVPLSISSGEPRSDRGPAVASPSGSSNTGPAEGEPFD